MRAPNVTALLPVLFALGGLPALAQTAPFFDDVPSYKPYYNHVNLMRIRFITTGCTFVPSRFCPEGAEGMLTRRQAAALIIRSIYSGSTGNPEGYSWYNPPQYFADVPPSHPQYIYIQKMAELGITSGCPVAGSYCPDDLLSYAQIATFAIRARMIREFGYIFPLNCNAQQGTFEYYNCNPYFTDVPTNEFFFPYVQKAYDLIGNLAKPPNCYYGSFCPWEQVARGYFAYYAVSLIMNASTPYSLPNGGNLPNVTAPYNPQAGIYMSCEAAATQNLIAGNMYVGVDANHVYTYASTAFPTGLMWPSLWMSYVWRQVSGPAPPYPAVADARLGNATKAELQSSSFSVSAGQTYTHTTKHGVISGCISPPPAELPYIVSTRTETAALTTQSITTSPPGLSLTVSGAWCGTPCTYQWLTGTGHSVDAALNQNLGGRQYQFVSWSDGGTATHTYYTPGANSNLVATYVQVPGGGPYTVTGKASPTSAGAVTPTTGAISEGSPVTFQATPIGGYVFDHWTIFTAFGTLTFGSNPLTLTVNGQTQAVATFRLSTAPSVNCFASANPAITGTPVTLMATVSGISNPTYSWSGYVSGTRSSVTFTPTEPGGYLGKVTVNGISGTCYVAVAAPALLEFRTCIGSTRIGDCELPPDIYVVPPRFGSQSSAEPANPRTFLQIVRSDFTIAGTSTSSSSDTILRRGEWFSGGGVPLPWPPAVPSEFLMEALDSTVTNVTIRNLMIDGNRYAPGLNCLPGNADFYDLDVSRGGKFTLENLQFIRAPGDAVLLAGNGSSISGSFFGHGYTPAQGVGELPLTEQQTASRSTAITLRGANNAALFNSVHYAGTAGITLVGTGQSVIGNSLFNNRYELSDWKRLPDLTQVGGGGGQLYLEGGSADAFVAGNVIFGGLWPPPVGDPNYVVQTGCSLPDSSQFNAGVEGYGYRHAFFNNEVVGHSGSGMQFAGSNPTESITISSAPYHESDTTERFIEGNANGGVVFLGDVWCTENGHSPCDIATGVTLDAVRVSKNKKGSVGLNLFNSQVVNSRITDKESSPPSSAAYTGFFNGSCIGENTDGLNLPVDIPVVITPEGAQPLSRPFPSSMTSYIPFPQTTPQTCPAPPWPTTIPPAAPRRPGWPW